MLCPTLVMLVFPHNFQILEKSWLQYPLINFVLTCQGNLATKAGCHGHLSKLKKTFNLISFYLEGKATYVGFLLCLELIESHCNFLHTSTVSQESRNGNFVSQQLFPSATGNRCLPHEKVRLRVSHCSQWLSRHCPAANLFHKL